MSYGRIRPDQYPSLETVASTLVAAFFASLAFSGILVATGNLDSVAAVYGLDGIVNDWAFVFVHCLVASSLFVVLIAAISRLRRTPRWFTTLFKNPFPCACLGIVYGTVLWLGIVAYLVPIWLELTTGIGYPVPLPHLESLLAFVWFGAVLGAWYPLASETLQNYPR